MHLNLNQSLNAYPKDTYISYNHTRLMLPTILYLCFLGVIFSIIGLVAYISLRKLCENEPGD